MPPSAFDFGSALTFGVTLLVHAERGDFQPDFSKVKLIYPCIADAEIARGVLRPVFDR